MKEELIISTTEYKETLYLDQMSQTKSNDIIHPLSKIYLVYMSKLFYYRPLESAEKFHIHPPVSQPSNVFPNGF